MERNILEITHLQYTDDTIILCGAEEEQLLIISLTFVYFEAISGLHINWNKSHLYPIIVVLEMDHFSQILGDAIGTLSSIYLGMTLAAQYRSIDIWILSSGEMGKEINQIETTISIIVR